MKFPKNRATVYLTERSCNGFFCICGVFPSLEEADSFTATCEQEWKERRPWDDLTTFKTSISTYYG